MHGHDLCICSNNRHRSFMLTQRRTHTFSSTFTFQSQCDDVMQAFSNSFISSVLPYSSILETHRPGTSKDVFLQKKQNEKELPMTFNKKARVPLPFVHTSK